MKNKTKTIIASAALAGIFLCSSAYALFTDYSETVIQGTFSSLTIDVNEFKMTNANNINPGDNDPDAPSTYVPLPVDPLYNSSSPGAEVPVPSTPHEITYEIANTGTASSRVRQTIYITCKDASGTILDPSVFSLYENEVELTEKYLVDENKKEYLVKTNDNSKELQSIPEGTKITAIKYLSDFGIFDGAGKKAQKEKTPNVQNVSGKTALSINYSFAMNKARSGNEYQATTITIDLLVEAIQNKNYVEGDWKTVSTQTIKASTSGLEIPSVENHDDKLNTASVLETTVSDTESETENIITDISFPTQTTLTETTTIPQETVSLSETEIIQTETEIITIDPSFDKKEIDIFINGGAG